MQELTVAVDTVALLLLLCVQCPRQLAPTPLSSAHALGLSSHTDFQDALERGLSRLT